MTSNVVSREPEPARDAGLAELLRLPLIVAPMAGGVSNVALVTAAGAAGALGVLAGGYKPVGAIEAEVTELQERGTVAFGVNLFVPGGAGVGAGTGPGPADVETKTAAALAAYAASLRPLAAELGTEVGEPRYDDDGWEAKLALVARLRPPVVSFTFGCPAAELIASLRAGGTHVKVTVTSPAEARIASAAGASSLCVQGPEAGGHRGSFTNEVVRGPGLIELIGEVRAVSELPLVAAGGIATPADLQAVLAAGAVAGQVGTALLRAIESGTGEAYRTALADPDSPETVLTRAFSGRPARGIRNRFIDEHADAPAAYPQVNNITRPLRAAAGAAGRAELLSLWAGTGYRQSRKLPAGEILRWLAGA